MLCDSVGPTYLTGQETHSFSPVGYINVIPIKLESEILSICVYQNYRGYGIDQALLALTLEKLLLDNCQSVFLEVRRSNEIAKRMYLKFGFLETGLRKRYYSDNFEDALIMSLNNFQNEEYRTFLKSNLQSLCYFRPANIK